ncbi:KH domain-containing protein [Ditylenchus destructor]|uniref:KH domain-containing protein n=1 Tax=Ditylenchus destructor TaxID=166010 RepID=A0AAD4RCE0_9BILA|nr:KH domain-containing protein [Ditylenchus destructor]
MGRSSDESDGNASNKDRRKVRQWNYPGSQDFKLRLLIPASDAGAIIGTRGDNAVAIRKKYDALFSIPDSCHPERVVIIICHYARMGSCFGDVLARLAELQEQRNHLNDRSVVRVRLLVHESHAGAVIGHGGSQIQKFREELNCKIEVFSRMCPKSSDQVMLLEGTEEWLVKAVESLVKFLYKIPLKGPDRPYDPANYDEHRAAEYGGLLPVGSDAARFRQPKRNIYRREMNTPSTSKNNIKSEIPNESLHDDNTARDHDTLTTKVSIPPELVGPVFNDISIRRASNESGAKISLYQATDGSKLYIFDIEGTAYQIELAQYLLQQSFN